MVAGRRPHPHLPAAEEPDELDLRPRADLARIEIALQVLSEELGLLFADAVSAGDFEAITRIGEADQAVARAVIALRPRALVGS